MDFSGKKVFITGASRGIGKALAIDLVHKGAEVFLVARNVVLLSSLTESLASAGFKAHFHTCDVSVKDELAAAVYMAEHTMGAIDIAILNAGSNHPLFFSDYDDASVERSFAVNLFGVTYAFAPLLNIMKAQGSGIIAVVSSLSDLRGLPGSGGYCASKAALSHLLEAARIELRKSPVKIITVKPGFIRTDMTASHKYYMPFLMDVEDASDIILQGISDSKSRIYFPWQMVLLCYLGKMVPSAWFEWALSLWYLHFSKL